MEDLQNTLSGHGLTVSSLVEKGRCLVATRDFSPGDTVIYQKPYASVLNDCSQETRCDACFTSSPSLKRCSACQMTWYCGSICQKSEWKFHQHECQALVKHSMERRKMVTPSIRLMVRLLVRRKLQNEKVVATTSTDSYNLVEALVAHMSDLNEKQLLIYAQMANLVKLILPLEEINLKEVAQNFSKLACNAHTICDSELRPLGTGLYPVISIINHSCSPNSVLVFEGRVAIVRAMDFIPKGNEVLISYIETAASTATRQKTLKEQYLFNCSCTRCKKLDLPEDHQESAILEGYKCVDKDCDGFLLLNPDDKIFKCQQCGLTRNKKEVQKNANEVEEFLRKASKCFTLGNYFEACIMYKTIEGLQLKLCHSYSVSLMRTRETLLKILIELKDWNGALKYCHWTILVYQRVYPANHPLLGLQCYTRGKLEWYLGQTVDAVKSLSKAVDILRITHGTSVPFMRDLLNLLDQAHAQATYEQCNQLKWIQTLISSGDLKPSWVDFRSGSGIS